MNERIVIAAISLDIAEADIDLNLCNVEKYLQGMAEAGIRPDIVALPELFSTGFIADRTKMSELAESNDGHTIQCVAKLASEFDCALTGGFAAREGDDLYNRAFFVTPGKEAVFYDKRHLFSLSAEAGIFSPGKELPPVMDFRGWKVSMIVCYDMRFPAWCRSIHYSYDIMVVPANWPQVRAYAWRTLLSARAIENQAVYVGCDRSGTDDYGSYDGMTAIMDAGGMSVDVLVDVGCGAKVAVAEITRKHLDQSRRRLPAGNDMDDFAIECNA